MVQQSKKRGFHGFTLIELVVVITILAILGTIGFLSVGGYSSRARDSGRVWDVALLSKSLDLGIITAGSYPTPDGYFTVTYSGGAVWYQGTVGNGVLQQLHSSIAGGGLGKKPVDPLKGTEFTYSTLAFGKAYQIKTEYEGDPGVAMEMNHFVPSASAAPGAPTVAHIKGNYGGLVAKTTTGSITYVLAVPSIVTGSGIAAGSLVEISLNTLSGTLLFNGKNLVGASSFNPNNVVFSGATLPTNDTGSGITNMMTALKTIYGTSDIASNANIANLISTSTGGLASLGASVLTTHLGGSASVIAPIVTGTGTNAICGTANGTSVASAPSTSPASNVCSVGVISGGVTGTGPWNWTCNSTNGGSSASCSASSNVVSGACTGIPANAYYFNGTTSYSLSNAAGGTSLSAWTAGYNASPTSNTCQWYCNATYAWNGSNGCITAIRGEQAYTTPGSYTWVVPGGVTSVSVLTIGAGGGGSDSDSSASGAGGGGGGLSYTNTISVTPGESITVVVGAGGVHILGTSTDGGLSSFARGATILTRAAGGQGGTTNPGGVTTATPTGGQASSGVGAVRNSGGAGGPAVVSGSKFPGGGGGAAGYSGDGGQGWWWNSVNEGPGYGGSGGGGGGGGRGTALAAAGGGGTGLNGAGANGGASSLGGYAGSSGTNGGDGSTYAGGAGGAYGGGGGGCDDTYPGVGANGAGGAVRIIYPGTSRAFPGTDTGP